MNPCRKESREVTDNTVGGDTLDRSWSVLKPGGRMVTIGAGAEVQSDQRVKEAFFIVEPNHEQLVEVSKLLDAGTLRTFVKAIVPFADAPKAYKSAIETALKYGKVVIAVEAV